MVVIVGLFVVVAISIILGFYIQTLTLHGVILDDYFLFLDLPHFLVHDSEIPGQVLRYLAFVLLMTSYDPLL
jgi:hypothetical protein